jgi:hypothetical protein
MNFEIQNVDIGFGDHGVFLGICNSVLCNQSICIMIGKLYSVTLLLRVLR